MKNRIILSLILLTTVSAVAAQQKNNGSINNLTPPIIDSVTHIYKLVDIMPENDYGVSKYISNHIRYPWRAREDGIQGIVYIRFIVRKDGSVDEPTVVRSSGNNELDNEGLRVVSNLPKWTPGKQNGEPVDVYFTAPISFHLR